ncbi:hypothetical protein ABEB36_008393 [Hypothenemus hampei]|uniref:Uncharacterized protein n=1 Tax=Hypothenemus hampei TaxID=57062 RepID=A0ABD1ELP1_HYPHA
MNLTKTEGEIDAETIAALELIDNLSVKSSDSGLSEDTCWALFGGPCPTITKPLKKEPQVVTDLNLLEDSSKKLNMLVDAKIEKKNNETNKIDDKTADLYEIKQPFNKEIPIITEKMEIIKIDNKVERDVEKDKTKGNAFEKTKTISDVILPKQYGSEPQEYRKLSKESQKEDWEPIKVHQIRTDEQQTQVLNENTTMNLNGSKLNKSESSEKHNSETVRKDVSQEKQFKEKSYTDNLFCSKEEEKSKNSLITIKDNDLRRSTDTFSSKNILKSATEHPNLPILRRNLSSSLSSFTDLKKTNRRKNPGLCSCLFKVQTPEAQRCKRNYKIKIYKNEEDEQRNKLDKNFTKIICFNDELYEQRNKKTQTSRVLLDSDYSIPYSLNKYIINNDKLILRKIKSPRKNGTFSKFVRDHRKIPSLSSSSSKFECEIPKANDVTGKSHLAKSLTKALNKQMNVHEVISKFEKRPIMPCRWPNQKFYTNRPENMDGEPFCYCCSRLNKDREEVMKVRRWN